MPIVAKYSGLTANPAAVGRSAGLANGCPSMVNPAPRELPLIGRVLATAADCTPGSRRCLDRAPGGRSRICAASSGYREPGSNSCIVTARCGTKPGSTCCKTQEAADQQPRAGEQHERQRDFRDDQRASGSRRANAARAAAAVVQRFAVVRARQLQRWHDAEDDSRGHRDERRKREDGDDRRGPPAAAESRAGWLRRSAATPHSARMTPTDAGRDRQRQRLRPAAGGSGGLVPRRARCESPSPCGGPHRARAAGSRRSRTQSAARRRPRRAAGRVLDGSRRRCRRGAAAPRWFGRALVCGYCCREPRPAIAASSLCGLSDGGAGPQPANCVHETRRRARPSCWPRTDRPPSGIQISTRSAR